MIKANKIALIIFGRTLLLFFIFIVPCITQANNDEIYSEIEIKFSKTNLSVKEALRELDKLPEIDVVFNGKESFLDLMLTLPAEKITVSEALKIIEEQAPVEIVFNNNHIIVKNRTLKSSYYFKGTLRDAETNDAIIAANVYIPGTTRGTVTNTHGWFSIQLPPGNYRFIIRYLGYKEKAVMVNLFNDVDMNLYIEPTLQEIKEVNILGILGKTEDLETGRTIEKIESKTINQLNTNVVNDALQGRINGVWTTKVSGAPGDHSKIRIRGVNSIFGSTDPLYVVDGVIIPIVNLKSLGIADLNSHDVDNITILKDASSTALYGNLGGNGVIMIETKKGGGETLYNFSVKQGIQWHSKRYPLMDSEEFLATKMLSDDNFHTLYYHYDSRTETFQKFPDYIDANGTTLGSDDYQDELFQNGMITEYQLSGKGGTKFFDFYISGNYYTHKGVVINSQYDKYSLTANLSKTFGDKLTLRLLYKGSRQENKNNIDNFMGNTVIYKGINYEPGYRYTPDSLLTLPYRSYNWTDYYGGNTIEGHTSDQLLDYNTRPNSLFYIPAKRKNQNSNTFNFHGKYFFTNELYFQAGISMSFIDMQYTSYLPKNMNDDEKYLSSDEHVVIFNQQYDLRYEKKYNGHNFSGFLRFRSFKDNVYWEIDSLLNVDLDGLKPEDDIYTRGAQSIYGEVGSTIRNIQSGIVNLNYNYRKKYSVSLIANYERLYEGHYVDHSGLFYSVAIDYDLAKEEILRMPEWIKAFHLYANMGLTGNYPLNSLSNDLFSHRTYSAGKQPVEAVYFTNLANHNLTHEKITEYNFGTELALFRNRIILSVDRYIKYSSDLLIQRAIPFYYGGGRYFQNIGKLENKGVEIGLEVTPFEQKAYCWTSKIGFSANTLLITKLTDGEDVSFNDIDVFFPDFYARENEPFGAITGYSYEGVWDDNIHANKNNNTRKYIKYKGIAYLNPDTIKSLTKLTEEDKTVIGKSMPDFTLNWINYFQFNNFSCEMLWFGVFGVDKFNATKACTYLAGTHTDIGGFMRDKMNFFTDKIIYESSYFIEDASFIRLKTLSFRYTQPKKLWGKIGLEYALSFENLVTITNYSGYDPEATIYTYNNFSDNAVDKGAYPNPQGVYFSINVSF